MILFKFNAIFGLNRCGGVENVRWREAAWRYCDPRWASVTFSGGGPGLRLWRSSVRDVSGPDGGVVCDVSTRVWHRVRCPSVRVTQLRPTAGKQQDMSLNFTAVTWPPGALMSEKKLKSDKMCHDTVFFFFFQKRLKKKGYVIILVAILFVCACVRARACVNI